MVLIDGVVKNYDWGSLTAIPELLGRRATGEPGAELWFTPRDRQCCASRALRSMST